MATVMVRTAAKASAKAVCMAPESSFLTAEEVAVRVVAVIRAQKQAPLNVKPNAHFVVDMKFDSFKRADVLEDLEREFCVPILGDARGEILSVPAAVEYFSTNPKAR
jgi:acyl carrier protein